MNPRGYIQYDVCNGRSLRILSDVSAYRPMGGDQLLLSIMYYVGGLYDSAEARLKLAKASNKKLNTEKNVFLR